MKAPGETATPRFDSPAVRPFRSEIQISTTQQGLYYYMCIWGPVRVLRHDLHPITVEDVMNAVFEYFQMPLAMAQVATQMEWELVVEAWRGRIRASPNSYTREYEKQRGVLRIDLLTAHCGTRFAGLRLKKGGFDGNGVDGLLLSVSR